MPAPKDPIKREQWINSKRGENNVAKRPDVRIKIRNSKLGKIAWNKGLTKETDNRLFVSDKTRQNMQSASKKRWRDSVYREKMLKISRENLKILNVNPEFQEKRLKGFNKAETREKIGDASRGRKLSEKHKENIKLSNLKHRFSKRKKMKQLWQDPSYIQKMANRPPSRNKRYDVWNDSQFIIQSYLDNVDAKKIAQKYNCSVVTIYSILKKNNIPRRPNVIANQQMYSEKRLKNLCKSPNKPEQKLNLILQSLFPNEWKFVGDGSFILGGKNPDFMNVNGQKKLIEMYGDYWHKKYTTRSQDYYIPEKRIELFKQFGFDTLIIWESELKSKDQSKLLEKLVSFNGKN